MFFHLISFDKKDETTTLKLKVVAWLPMSITRLSHESSKENNKPIHLSSLEILMSINNYLLTIVLKALRFSFTKYLYFILRLYNLFHRNNLFKKDLDLYNFPNLFHKSFAKSSPNIFNSTESKWKKSYYALFLSIQLCLIFYWHSCRCST